MKKGNCVCLWILWTVFLALSVLSVSAIVVFGAVGILNAKTVNDERYMRAYCSEEDNSERVWLYWMTGSSAATILFCLFGTFTFILGVFLFSTLRTQNYNITTPGSAAPQAGDQIEMKDHEAVVRTDKEDKEALADDKDKNLRQNMIATAIAVPMIMFFSSVALLSFLWCVAIAYENARTPTKQICLYIIADVFLGIVMPVSLVVAGGITSVLLKYITGGRIDTREVIAKMLSIKLKKDKDGVACHWIIQSTFYLDCYPMASDKTCSKICRSSWATCILAIIVSLSFILSISYFIDQTVAMSHTLQDWPDRSSVSDLDCFLPMKDSFFYVSPMEQEPTDRLHNCTVFFEQCQSNCSVDDFQSCAQDCANCLTLCTTTLRSDLEMVRVCDPPPVNNEGPSCPVSNAACITAANVLPQDNSSCQAAQGTPGSGDASAEIAPIIVNNHTQRLERCAGLLQSCGMQVSMCTSPNCTELQQCNTLLQDCHKPPVIICFRFLQFGRSANAIQALAESYALFLSAVSLFGAIFSVVHILLHIKKTKLWGIGFVIMTLLLIVVGVPVLVTNGIYLFENIIRMLQFGLAPIYILLMGLLFLVAYFPPDKQELQATNPPSNPPSSPQSCYF